MKRQMSEEDFSRLITTFIQSQECSNFSDFQFFGKLKISKKHYELSDTWIRHILNMDKRTRRKTTMTLVAL